MEYDYPNPISPADLHVISNFINLKLKTTYIEADAYLQWFFDEFLERKPTFKPGTIKLACGALVWNDFLFQHKDALKEKKEKELQNSEVIDLINRARQLIRVSEDPKTKTKISGLIRKIMDDGIVFSDFKSQILEFEAQLRQNKGE
jgi:hypothetical protein